MKTATCFIAIGLLLGSVAQGSNSTPPAADGPQPEAVKKWQEMRFGMFIHWGPVSLTGKEIGWSRGAGTPAAEYDALYKQFNPVNFNADEWVQAAKDAGMKYMILTTKHHDGFCLWNTKETPYNIMNTPFKRDVVKELSDACKKQGIAFGTYYSVTESAKLLSGADVEFQQSEKKVILNVHAARQDRVDTIVALRVDRPAIDIAPIKSGK